MVEHVAGKTAFLAQAAACLAPGGLMIVSTPNRTAQSRLLMVGAAEAIGLIPRGTHDWDDFVTPEELGELLESLAFAASRFAARDCSTFTCIVLFHGKWHQ